MIKLTERKYLLCLLNFLLYFSFLALYSLCIISSDLASSSQVLSPLVPSLPRLTSTFHGHAPAFVGIFTPEHILRLLALPLLLLPIFTWSNFVSLASFLNILSYFLHFLWTLKHLFYTVNSSMRSLVILKKVCCFCWRE